MALMVHDLKNPLAALLANLGYVASTVADDEYTAEAIEDCMISTEVLKRLIDNLASLFSALPQVPGSVASVESVVRTVEARTKRHANASSLQLEVLRKVDNVQAALSGPALELALDNVLACAMAYAPSASTVRLVVDADRENVRLSVYDQGPPVSDEMKPHVGDLDGQIELKGATGARYSRGLGLFVASTIVTAVGGVLEARDGEGGGSVMELRVPVAEG